jgi:hypothetical protein
MTVKRKCQFCNKEVPVLASCGCAGEREEKARRIEVQRQHLIRHEPKGKRMQRQANWAASGSLSGDWIG